MRIDLNTSKCSEEEKTEPDFNEEESFHSISSKELSESDVDSSSFVCLRKEIEKKLEVGARIGNLEEIYLLYCEYARLMGFSVKKGTQVYFQGSLEVKVKVFHCSCKGYPDNKRSVGRIASYKKQVTRTNCKARLRVIREKDGPWTVSVFFRQHNHELASPEQSSMLRSARHMSHAKKYVLDALKASGINVSRAYRFMEKEAGGRENVGFTRKDAYAYVNSSGLKTKVENGDANELLKYFIDKSNTESFFYWNVQLDDDGRLMNFFFRDTRSAIDYKYFGDVLCVVTTYRTNKYNLVCAPFVGINHHRTNVMFGLAFLSDETTKSFEWLFGCFLESMNGKEPGIIFSDQCQALMNGVDNTFASSSHRLCQWHISQNAPSHFGSLNGKVAFKKLWYHCMNGCEDDKQFDATWQTMMVEYELNESRWFRNMYNLHKRWVSVFTNTKFMAGLHDTSRSEVTNKVLKQLCSSASTLFDFVMQYEKIQIEWRRRETEEDAMCRGLPGQFIQNNHLLMHVATVYTRNVYKSFEYETVLSLNVKIIHHPTDLSGDELEFVVSSSSAFNGIRTVYFNRHTYLSRCSCRMWEAEGILCRHILKVFLLLNVERLPDEFVLKRWMKDAKLRVSANGLGESVPRGSDTLGNLVFVNHQMRTIYELMHDCKDDKNCKDLIEKSIDDLVKGIRNLKPPQPAADAHVAGGAEEFFSSRPIRNPRTPKKRKYPTKRLCRHWDSPRPQHPPKPASPRAKKKTCLDVDLSAREGSQNQACHSSQPSGSRQPGSHRGGYSDLQSQNAEPNSNDFEANYWQRFTVGNGTQNSVYGEHSGKE